MNSQLVAEQQEFMSTEDGKNCRWDFLEQKIAISFVLYQRSLSSKLTFSQQV